MSQPEAASSFLSPGLVLLPPKRGPLWGACPWPSAPSTLSPLLATLTATVGRRPSSPAVCSGARGPERPCPHSFALFTSPLTLTVLGPRPQSPLTLLLPPTLSQSPRHS